MFTDPLLFGLLSAGLGLAVAGGWWLVRRPASSRSVSWPIAGLLFAAAALAGYQRTGHLVLGLAISIAVLVGGGLVGEVARLPAIPRLLLTIPGAVILATGSALPDPLWARVFAGVITVIGTGLIESLDGRCRRLGLGPILLAITVVGLYETVPDPDFALLLVGAALPVALLAWPFPLTRLGTPGAAAAAGLLAWADAAGGRGRLGTVVAGAACLGLFAVEPLTRLLLRGRRTFVELMTPGPWSPLLISLVQLGLAAACTRIALDGRTPAQAGVITGTALVLAVGVTRLVSDHRSQRTPRVRRTER